MRMISRRQLLLTVMLMTGLILPGRLLRAQQGSQAQADHSKPTRAERRDAEDPEADPNDEFLQSASVKMMGTKLGMSTQRASVAFQVANFLLLAVGVGWILVKFLPKALRGRSSAIQKHLVEARTVTEEANVRLNSVEERLSKLDRKIAAMRAQAEKDSAAEEQRIKASVEEEKTKILAAAEQEIAAATTQARRQIQQYAAELAIEQAARKLVVSAETDRLLVQNFALRLSSDDSKEGQN